MDTVECNKKLDLYIDACIAYYYDDYNIMSDFEYDQLAADLLKNYDKLPDWFKELVAKQDFEGGGYVVCWKFGKENWTRG